MRKFSMVTALLVSAYLLGGTLSRSDVLAQPDAKLDVERIGKAAGVKAKVTLDDVVRIGWPRTHVSVRVDGMPL